MNKLVGFAEKIFYSKLEGLSFQNLKPNTIVFCAGNFVTGIHVEV